MLFILIIKKCMKHVYRLGSSQCSPQTMHAWERIRNFITSKRICGLKDYKRCLEHGFTITLILSLMINQAVLEIRI